jgi:hypothetical protein
MRRKNTTGGHPPATRRPRKTGAETARRTAPAGADMPGSAEEEEQVFASSLSLHDLFQQQTRQMLDRTDLDEEQKQTVLIAMSCPCCGAGGMSFTLPLKR